MIRDFACRETERIWHGERSLALPAAMQQAARRKLRMLDSAVTLADLRQPPGNRLEALHGNRRGQHSIRINDRWRVCFVWRDGHSERVEIVDYH